MNEEKPEQETSQTQIQKNKKDDWSWKDLLFFLVLTAIIVFPIRFFVAQPFLVSGDSMIPTFHTGEYLVVDQLSYDFSDPERGDVVIFRFPQDENKFFIKRIIGLPGETVLIDGFEVFVKAKNGQNFFLLEENFLDLERESYSEVTLADDEYFVMGDNRLQSLDSRVWGPLKEDYILGRAFLRLLPVNKIDFLPGKINYQIVN